MTDTNMTQFDENGNEVRRPTGTYDNLIVFIEKFPLRLVICFAGLCMLLNLAIARDGMSGDALWGATLGYIFGFFVVLGEAVFGKVTRLIKDILLRIVISAEKNAEVL